jgi:peptidoglycan/xylan/chitin deacetylase (PgdA/CDA1 family)
LRTDSTNIRIFVLLTLGLAVPACMQSAEPRWLVKALPGTYPEVVYFVPTQERAIALTIDDGLDAATTPQILDVLSEHKVSATFFLVSNSLLGNEALARRIVKEGHEIGHHMTEDEVTVALDEEELTAKFDKAADALEAIAPISWFRPGSGRYNDQVLALVKRRGYRIAMASVAPLDTIISSPGSMARFINWMVQPGSVVVLHDVEDRGRRTVETLDRLLPILQDRGYAVMSLGELDALYLSDSRTADSRTADSRTADGQDVEPPPGSQ